MNKKKLKSVFSELLPNEERKAAWQTFMEQTEHLQKDPYANKVWNKYKSLVESEEFKHTMSKAAQLELTLTQLHQMSEAELTIGTIKQDRGNEIVEYVIVRCPFTEEGKKRKEVRVYMGRMDDIRKTVAQLKRDPKFLQEARDRVMTAMKTAFMETQKNTKKWV
jgi:hypothetical protein